VKTRAGNLVILGGDEMAELPIDAINSRCRPEAAKLIAANRYAICRNP
jgi:hypothetical protein